MRALTTVRAWQSQLCCRSRLICPAHAAPRQLHASNGTKPLPDSCLYVLDLLPLVYRYLPREPAQSAVPNAAAAEGGVVQQQQQPQPAVPAPADVSRSISDPAEDFLGGLLGVLKRKTATPTHMAIVVDVPGSTYRHRMYPQYKAHRHQHPPSLTRAISRILSIVEALGIPVLAVPGVEADDVVGTLATKAQQDGFGSVVIMSTDKDYYQLLSPTVSIMRTTYGELYTLEQFQQEQQLSDPRLWIDIKTLMGDVTDNIPGLKSVGEKTAQQLVRSFGTVEQVFQQLATLSEEQQKQVVKLNKPQRAMLLSEEGQVAAAFIKELVTINTHLKAPPCQQPWSVYELKLPADGGKRALEWSQSLGMHWLSFRLREHLQSLTE